MTLTASQVDERIRGLRSLDDVRGFIAALGFAYADEQLSARGLPDKVSGANR